MRLSVLILVLIQGFYLNYSLNAEEAFYFKTFQESGVRRDYFLLGPFKKTQEYFNSKKKFLFSKFQELFSSLKEAHEIVYFRTFKEFSCDKIKFKNFQVPNSEYSIYFSKPEFIEQFFKIFSIYPFPKINHTHNNYLYFKTKKGDFLFSFCYTHMILVSGDLLFDFSSNLSLFNYLSSAKAYRFLFGRKGKIIKLNQDGSCNISEKNF